ncbi:hypothetical protein SCLCIDRAFT_250695 [Scleroderma citrinum Foug A]|uniref:Uncharacterized protein n=1 Tax=Scleroderma citrinum Foug A TaxID=1036808 RepID=A0A0C2Z2U7_9AGAM|nr:hypothetical protein SCLCIDRAFT_250695 [Scleroderma citrinum Foug A]
MATKSGWLSQGQHLVAVLEVEGSDMIKVKKGLVVGKEVSFLEMILGDEGGCVCRLTAYHDMAELWGAYYGSGPDLPPGGDVPHFEILNGPLHSLPLLPSQPPPQCVPSPHPALLPHTTKHMHWCMAPLLGQSDLAIQCVIIDHSYKPHF